MLLSRIILIFYQNFSLNNFFEVECTTLEGCMFHICVTVIFQNLLIQAFTTLLNTAGGILINKKAFFFPPQRNKLTKIQYDMSRIGIWEFNNISFPPIFYYIMFICLIFPCILSVKLKLFLLFPININWNSVCIYVT